MQLPEISIRRPVFATVLSLLVLLVGAVSFTACRCASTPRSTSRWSPSASSTPAPRPR
jgi:multidrug efflux pump subunit AcrB